ncbi:MAG: hypothetical protein JSS60_08540 [Verrucomicrobia bacterium]|nr:hypothetical protein [Verrucomicrobiota bacterium]
MSSDVQLKTTKDQSSNSERFSPSYLKWKDCFDSSGMSTLEIEQRSALIETKFRNISARTFAIIDHPLDPENFHLPTKSSFYWTPITNALAAIRSNCTLAVKGSSIIASIYQLGSYSFVRFESPSSKQSMTVSFHHKDYFSSLFARDNLLFLGTTSSNEIMALKLNSSAFPMDYEEVGHKFTGHQGRVLCLDAWGDQLISGSEDHSIRFWDIKTGDCTDTLSDHGCPVTSLCVAGDHLFSGDEKGFLKVWDLNTKKCLQTLNIGSRSRIESIKFDSPFLYVSPSLKPIQVLTWRETTLEPLQSIDKIAGVFMGMTIKDGRLAMASAINLSSDVFRCLEIEMDFGTAASQKALLEYLAKGFSQPHSVVYTAHLMDQFMKLDQKVQEEIFKCMDEVLSNGDFEYTSTEGSARKAFFNLPASNEKLRLLLDSCRTEAIHLYLKK